LFKVHVCIFALHYICFSEQINDDDDDDEVDACKINAFRLHFCLNCCKFLFFLVMQQHRHKLWWKILGAFWGNFMCFVAAKKICKSVKI